MQASIAWQPPVGTLGEALAETRKRVASFNSASSNSASSGPLSQQARPGEPARAALVDVLRGQTVSVIAEVKRRSPSRGAINLSLDAAAQAELYERWGAAAISILTEPRLFGGSLDDLHAAAKSTSVPLLKKDFHIAASQLTEARDSGASGVLLIARALPPQELIALAALARQLGVEPLIEVHTESELDTAIAAGARIIGVNSRDLETLRMDAKVPERLMPLIPPHVVAVWESGVETSSDVWRAAASGADAVLVGSALSRVASPDALLRELVGVPRRPRG